MASKKTANALLGLLAQTSIHAGTGQNTGAIDLPIQREGHNGYPCVFGSSMKGALRNHAETICDLSNKTTSNKIKFAFGPDTDKASDHAGALMISDARLLLLPVRSLTSQFKWVTCPAILQRFKNDAARFDIQCDFNVPTLASDEENKALVYQHDNKEQQSLFLEEYRLLTDTDQKNEIIKIIAEVAKLMSKDEYQKETESLLEKQLVIVNDNLFSFICNHATPINAHITIDSDTKIVKPGALWYEETLPPETLLYLGVAANRARKPRDGKSPENFNDSAEGMLATVTDLFTDKPWLQIGGNETVGMGWCAVKTLSSDSNGGNG